MGDAEGSLCLSGRQCWSQNPRQNEGQGHLSQQLGVLAGGPRMGYSIPFEEATEARCSGHLLMCAWSFQREKLPKAKHFIQI